jgi:CRISPR-associated protein Cmr1
MPESIKAEYNIITPMFIGDVNKKVTGIPPTSVKGALRFWWRTLNWGLYCNGKDETSDQAALQKLHQGESFLFGSAAEHGTGQSRVIIRIKTDDIPPPKDDWPKSGSDSGYLGMGLWQSGKKEKGNFQAARQYICENTKFSIEAIFHPSLSEGHIQSLKDTFIIFGLLGGLGSRSRRAFGSVALLKLDNNNYKFDSIQQYRDALHEMLKSYDLPVTRPPYTAFSQESKIRINSEPKSSAKLAHAELGHLFKLHRGQPSELRGIQKRVFGMPYSGGGPKENNARRASPLLMHIHRIKNDYHSVATAFPALFHHEKELKKVDYNLILSFFNKFEEVPLS